MDHSTRDRIKYLKQPRKSAAARPAAVEDVRFRAYQIYVSRNREPGHELDDWLQAERELLSRN
jgi:hypothetical protein